MLEIAKDAGLQRFVFTSSYVTVGRKRGRVATEDDIIVERGLTAVRPVARAGREPRLEYAREHGLPAVAMCVSTTYGSGDWGRTPHGAIIAGAAFGKLPFVMNGIELEAVGVDDAARALILAAEHGRVGERYLISEKMISNAEVVRIAAEAAGVAAADQVDSAADVLCAGHVGERQGPAARHRRAAVAGSLRLMRAEAPVDCAKARRELGWEPRPVEESIREAARFWVGLRDAKRKSKQAG